MVTKVVAAWSVIIFSHQITYCFFFNNIASELTQLLYNAIHMEFTNIRILKRRQRNNNIGSMKLKNTVQTEHT